MIDDRHGPRAGELLSAVVGNVVAVPVVLGFVALSTSDTGLGLPFCKLAVERMGGRIALSSAPGVGTTFAVTLRRSS